MIPACVVVVHCGVLAVGKWRSLVAGVVQTAVAGAVGWSPGAHREE